MFTTPFLNILKPKIMKILAFGISWGEKKKTEFEANLGYLFYHVPPRR